MFADELKTFRRLGLRHVCSQYCLRPTSTAKGPRTGFTSAPELCFRHCFWLNDLERPWSRNKLGVTYCRRPQVCRLLLQTPN